jgi:hypothetical protein
MIQKPKDGGWIATVGLNVIRGGQFSIGETWGAGLHNFLIIRPLDRKLAVMCEHGFQTNMNLLAI